MKTASGEFSAPLTELHDTWWNSIARASFIIFTGPELPNWFCNVTRQALDLGRHNALAWRAKEGGKIVVTGPIFADCRACRRALICRASPWNKNIAPSATACAIANAIRRACDRNVTPLRVCECGCSQFVTGRARLADVACRKRIQRQRDASSIGAKNFQLEFA